MNERQPAPPPPGLTLADIYFVLFRHKGKILGISAAAVALAAVFYLKWPVPYQSEAKLFVRYVVETKAPAQNQTDAQKVKLPTERGGENVINTELEILSSLDLAQQVADLIGPEKILATAGGGTNRFRAAVLIQKNLIPEVLKRSDVIHLTFQHRDAELVQPVLNQVIETYLRKHAETHRAIGVFDEFLTKQTDKLRASLSTTEDELRKAKAKAGVLSVEDSKKIYTEQISKIQSALLEAEAGLAERQAEIATMAKYLPANALSGLDGASDSGVPTGAHNAKVVGGGPAPRSVVTTGTNVPKISAEALAPQLQVPSGTVAEYNRVNGLLDTLTRRQTELLVQFTPESSLVKGVASQISDAEKRKTQLEQDNPGLLPLKVTDTRGVANAAPIASAPDSRLSLALELAKLASTETKIKKLTEQLERLRKEAAVVNEAEGNITELERKRSLEESQYTYSARNLEEARTDEQLGAVKNSDINPIQMPSPPFQDAAKVKKAAAGILFGGIVLALALAFIIEWYLDPSLKRPIEIETKVGLPLFLSIPRLRIEDGNKRLGLNGARKAPLLTEGAGDQSPSAEPATAVATQKSEISPRNGKINGLASWDIGSPLRPFHDALRDRLITHFEVRNLTHKPKLVAVTSCANGSGVTTVAAGLAASLSETGDGNVLLVNMNHEGAARQFSRGDLTSGLDQALEVDKRDTALVQENLYVVRGPHVGDGLPYALPKLFHQLVPKLRASDYDYIIFDLPPVSQISITQRLARFMDISLIVVEAEQTDRDVVKRAGAILTQSGADVGVVLNKSRAYVPRRLAQEL